MKNTIAGLVCLGLVAFGLGTWTGIAVQNHDSHDLAVSKESAAEFRLVEQVWSLTETYYVDKAATEPQRLAYTTIAGMINSLGDTLRSYY